METVRLSERDMDDALALVWEVFQEFESPEYPQEGIDSFRDFIRPKSVREKMKCGEILFWGCRIDGNLAGVIALRDLNHISLLFVRRAYQRRGIARKLFRMAEEYCRDKGCNSITVHSSPYAVGIYRKMGFYELSSERMEHGIRFIPMEYTINLSF